MLCCIRNWRSDRFEAGGLAASQCPKVGPLRIPAALGYSSTPRLECSIIAAYKWRYRLIASAGVLALAVGGHARAQHVSDNAVVSAEDAFGLTVGNETIGLYDPYQVCGFNPQDAGNVRVSGLYFDQQGPLSARVIEGSTIRVGMSAVGYAFPGPTGIVDCDLRHVGDKPALTLLLGGGPFATRAIDLDGQVPIASLNLKIPLGISDRITDDFSGYSVHTVSAAIAPQWTPRAGLVVRMFFDWQRNSRDLIVPEIHLAGAALPPHSPSTYWGQSWATLRVSKILEPRPAKL